MSVIPHLIFRKSFRVEHLNIIFRRILLGLAMLAFLLITMPGCGSPQTSEKLAFVSVQGESRRLYIVQADGSGLREVSNAVAWSRPKWSLDGRRLAFVSEYQGLPSLYVIGESNETPLRLTTGVEVGSYAWAPTGNEIAFSAIQGAEEDIYVVSLDILDLVNLTSGNNAADYVPIWSRDGTHIAFLSSPGINNRHLCQEGCRYKVYIMEKGGSNSRRIAAGSPLIDEHMSECVPAWSPDDRYLTFTHGCHPSEPSLNIYVFDLQTGKMSQLTTNETIDRWSVWLSNDELLFGSFRDEAYVEQLYVMNRDGTNQRPFLPWDVADINSIDWTSDHHWFVWQDEDTNEILIGDFTTEQTTHTGIEGCNPEWSPSGSWIAFTTECLGAVDMSDIWVMNKDKSQLLNLTADVPGRNYQPVWSP